MAICLSFQCTSGDLENSDNCLSYLSINILKISGLHDLDKSRQHSSNLYALWMVNDPHGLSGSSPHQSVSFHFGPEKGTTF